jgi:hypothetical protein
MKYGMSKSSVFCRKVPSSNSTKCPSNFAKWQDTSPLSSNTILFDCNTVSGTRAQRHSSVGLLSLLTRSSLCVSTTASAERSITGVTHAQAFKKHLPMVTTWTSSLSQTLSVHFSHCQIHPSGSKVWYCHVKDTPALPNVQRASVSS